MTLSEESGYELQELLGRGAMGQVYKARDRHLGRFVAVKVLKPELSSDERAVERFKREAALAARLNHTNIVTLFGVEFFENSYRIVFEYVEGMSLATLISKIGPQETRFAIELIKQSAAALDEAHKHDLIHRDIKPHNILLSKDNRVKVTDFGLARAFREESDLTTDGHRLGTPRYMSPEQVQAAPLTYHTDIYSLGVVLFELLAGKPAFAEADPLALMHRISEGPFPDIRGVNERVGDDVAKIIAKMVAANPLDRYHSADRLKDDLEAWLDTGVAPVAEQVTLHHEGDAEAGDKRRPAGPNLISRGDETDFILHHVHSDYTWAEWIEAQLKEAGYKVELAPWDFKKSGESLRELMKAAEKRTCIVAVVSPTYLKALHSHRNWSVAYHQGDLSALPVIVSACFLGSTFNTNYFVDLTELSGPEGKQALLDEAVELRGIPEGRAGSALEAMLQSLKPVKLSQTVWNVPVDPSATFVGRSQILTKIYTDLNEKGGISTLTQPSESDVGLGLSQLAAEYAHLNKANYSLVMWVRCQRQATLLGDYVSLADLIGLPEKDSPKISLRSKAVKYWLANNSNWLIIFDGARSLDYVATLLPRRMTGHAIITSARPSWPDTANPTPVPALSRQEAVDFLYQRTGERNEGAAASLASCLGDVPLALALASAQIQATGVKIDKYIDLFLERHLAMWGTRSQSKASPQVVTTAVSLSVEQIALRSPGAMGILKLCCYLAASDIPVSRLSSSAKSLPKPLQKTLLNTTKLNEELGLLKKFDLVQEKNDLLFMHHAIQMLLCNWIESNAGEEQNETKAKLFYAIRNARFERKSPNLWAQAALSFILATTPEDPRRSERYDTFARMFAHTEIILKHAKRLDLKHLDQFHMWRRVGLYQLARLDYQRATQAYRRAIEFAMKARGDKHSDVADLYKELAHVHRAEGDFKRATQDYEAALAIDTKVYGKKHKAVSAGLFSLGNVSVHLGDHARGRQYYTRALEVDLELGGKFSEDVGRDYTYLGLVSQELGDLTASWEHYTAALEICEKVFDESHERVGSAVKNLAGLLQKMGDLSKAKELYRRAIDIDTAQHGERHPEVAQDYNNLGIVEEWLGMPHAATEHYFKALEINRAVYGDDHLKVAINRNNLANMLRREGELDKAEENYDHAVRIFGKTLGQDHEHTATAVRNRARVQAERRTGKTSSDH